MKETLLLFLCYSSLVSNIQSGSRVYKVIASRFSNFPIISKATGSAWDFCYNPAVYNYNNSIGLIARCHNLTNPSKPGDIGPSYLSTSQVTFNDSGFPFATPMSEILLGPNNTTEKCGPEDPRVAYLDGTYYMFYNAYDYSNPGISIAVSNDPTNPGRSELRIQLVEDSSDAFSNNNLRASMAQILQAMLFWTECRDNFKIFIDLWWFTSLLCNVLIWRSLHLIVTS